MSFANNSSSVPALPERFSGLVTQLDALAAEAVSAIRVCDERHDPTFGFYGGLAGFTRAAASVEGLLLENGLRLALGHDGSFCLKPSNYKLPLVEAALEAVRSNDADALRAVRLGSRVYASEHYKPDIIAVSRSNATAFILELKRTTSSYGNGRLAALEEKLTAAALVVGDVLHNDRSRLRVDAVEIAIIDCSDLDTRDGVIGLSGLDDFLGCPGLAACLKFLRTRFANHVQNALASRFAAICADGEAKALGAIPSHALIEPEQSVLRTAPDAGVVVRFARKRQLAAGL